MKSLWELGDNFTFDEVAEHLSHELKRKVDVERVIGFVLSGLLQLSVEFSEVVDFQPVALFSFNPTESSEYMDWMSDRLGNKLKAKEVLEVLHKNRCDLLSPNGLWAYPLSSEIHSQSGSFDLILCRGGISLFREFYKSIKAGKELDLLNHYPDSEMESGFFFYLGAAVGYRLVSPSTWLSVSNLELKKIFDIEMQLPLHSKFVIRKEALRKFLHLGSSKGEPRQAEAVLEKSHSNKSDKLAYLNQASNKFWANVDLSDSSTYPTNEEITEFLLTKGFSLTLANSAASIIRPEKAKTGRHKEQ
jgi:hypothetical protein